MRWTIPIKQTVMTVLRASLSGKGYQITRDVMRLNQFLGDLVGGPAVLGEWAFIFCLFGTPSESEPWGWQLFGHHLSLNCLVIGGQMVLTPCFFGAEPNYADTGPFAGTRLFEDEERAGLGVDALVFAGAAAAGHCRAFHDGRRPAGGPASFRRQLASRRRLSGQPHRAV